MYLEHVPYGKLHLRLNIVYLPTTNDSYIADLIFVPKPLRKAIDRPLIEPLHYRLLWLWRVRMERVAIHITVIGFLVFSTSTG
jgi:hypothetical protein